MSTRMRGRITTSKGSSNPRRLAVVTQSSWDPSGKATWNQLGIWQLETVDIPGTKDNCGFLRYGCLFGDLRLERQSSFGGERLEEIGAQKGNRSVANYCGLVNLKMAPFKGTSISLS